MFISRGSYSKVNKLNYQIGYEVDIESSIVKELKVIQENNQIL